MNATDILKKNFVMIPVVVSIVVGSFTGVKYIVSLSLLRLEISLEKEDQANIKNQNLNQKNYSKKILDIKAVASEKATQDHS